MIQSEKLKVLIDSIKTANDLMRKQIEINGRAVELLGEFITEPEQVVQTPLTSTLTRVAQQLESIPQGEYKEIPIGVFDKDGKLQPYIKPEDMKAGEWYVKTRCDNDFMFKFKDFDSLDMNPIAYYILVNPLGEIRYNDTTSYFPSQTTLRKATQKEILKYFPNELEVPTHGGNDAAHI